MTRIQSPREKYQLDNNYKMFVDNLVHLILMAKYTPSEIREMALLACIIYEEHRVYELRYVLPDKACIRDALARIDMWVLDANQAEEKR